jgi:hypothetical protein
MTKHLRNLGVYNKALVAALGGVVITVEAAKDVVPGPWSVGILAALTAVSVLLVGNADKIDRVGDDLADLLER